MVSETVRFDDEDIFMNTMVMEAGRLPQDRAAPGLLGMAERGLVPDSLIRDGHSPDVRGKIA